MRLKKYPKVIVLKKSLIGVATLVISLIVLLILRNIYTSTHMKQAPIDSTQKISVVESVASVNDTRWYSNQTMLKAHVAENVMPTAVTPPKLRSHLSSARTSREATTLATDNDSHDAEALADAMGAPISSNQLTAQNGMDAADTTHPSNYQTAATDTQRGQDEKSQFLATNQQASQEVLLQHVKKPLSPFEIKAGSNIPGVLIGGINSDLPGEITALVRSNVFDSVSGNDVLIPQGAKLQGIYDSQVAYAQQRLLVVWTRILFPNGDSLNLEGMPGTDLNGYAGFGDSVNNHYGKIFGSAILGSVISAGAQLSQPQNLNNNPFAAPSIGQTMAQSLGTNIANTTVAITNKNIGIPPTITIRPGYKFNIKVTKDLVFAAPYED